MMQMMHHDRPEAKAEKMANVRLYERNFCNVLKFNNLRSSWKEWKRQFLGVVRECDLGFCDYVETFEGRGEQIDHILEYTPTHSQSSSNM